MGRVWLLDEDPHDRELVFSYGFDEELNAAVKQLPRRWFDWRRKHWRVPADPRIAKEVEELLARFGELQPSPDVLAWLSDSDRWRALVSAVVYEGRGAFALRTLSGGFAESLPMSTSRSGITPKTKAGPNHHMIPRPVASARPQPMKGMRGTIRPSSHR